jgi:hypothetical protein
VTRPEDAATRAELLAARAEQLPALERRAWSPVAAGEVSLWAVVLTVAVAAPDLTEGVATVALLAVVGAVALWRLAARLRGWLRARAEVAGWRRADRSARARVLPAGAIPAGLRTPFDARDDADLAEVLGEAGATAAGRVYDLRMVSFGLALVPALVMWIIAVAMVFVGETTASRVVAAVVAVVLGVVVGRLYVGWQRELWHRQQALGSSGLEKDLWLARQSLLRGEELPAAAPAAPLAARLVLGAIALAILAFLVMRVLQASGPVLLVVLGVLVALAVPAAVGLVRRRALHVVPLLHDGDDVLSTPWHPVTVDRDETGLTVRSDRAGDLAVPASDVLGVVPVSPGYALAPATVAVVRREGEPVVLAGRGATDLLGH